MITNFKLFEKEGDKFKIGTWVLLTEESEELNQLAWNVYPYVKIVDNESTKYHNNEDETPLNDYQIETFVLKTNQMTQFWVDDFEIDRKLTPEEIEDTKAII